ncbi:MAG TPA: Fe-S-containing protein [Thermodesulfovibrionales bacterium]|nr:Fe-S-containing protein [Thermodesulfovibrionales bacterium]
MISIGGSVLSFLDACATCYQQKKGYSFDNGYFICRACGVRYSVSDIEKGIGGCYPIRISGNLRDRKYSIPVSTLRDAADRF